MTVIVVTAAEVGRLYVNQDLAIPIFLGATITAGQVVRQDTDGKYILADATVGGADARQTLIALKGGVDGEADLGVKEGALEGYAVSGLSAGAQLFLSDTAGAVDDAAGTVSVPIGRVIGTAEKDPSDGTVKEVAYFDMDWNTQFA
jgi:hypothetical protein